METPTFQTHLLEKENPTPNILMLRFKKPGGFEFKAGQFVQFEIPVTGGEPVQRSFSLSSTPADPYLEFCVKILPDGVASQYFQNMKIGEQAAIKGPLGFFVIKNELQPLFAVATGAGLAPVFGILRDELENKQTNRPVRLLFGVRSPKDIFWQDRLEKLHKMFSNFSYQLTLSRPDDQWRGVRGRVSAHLPGAVGGHDFYICGSAPMVKDVRGYLIARKVPMSAIHFEVF